METPESSDEIDRTRIDLSKLMEWYSSHCDGEWEHIWRVRLETIDNPGWRLRVNLVGTNLEGVRMEAISEDADTTPFGGNGLPWIECWISDNQFQGACDPTQLPRLISTFYALIDSAATSGKG